MKKKSNLPFLFKAMGPFRICMLLSIVFAAASAIVSIKAYTYVYLIAEELIANLAGGLQKGLFLTHSYV